MFTEPDWKGHSSVEGSTVSIGDGTIIRENVIINLPAKNDLTVIGSNCYLMNTCFVGHDSIIGNNVTLCPHACVAGHVSIGDYTTIGMNASIHQGSTIGRCCMIGAGSFFKGISPDGITWVGVPARPLKVNMIGIDRCDLSIEEKEKILSNAQLFIDDFECSRNIKAECGVAAPKQKTGNIILNCVRRFKIPYIFN
jgi:acyl-[acyl carrier protein]--UDP-N-acetylglucosamine O-acyltransferase